MKLSFWLTLFFVFSATACGTRVIVEERKTTNAKKKEDPVQDDDTRIQTGKDSGNQTIGLTFESDIKQLLENKGFERCLSPKPNQRKCP